MENKIIRKPPEFLLAPLFVKRSGVVSSDIHECLPHLIL